MNPPQRVCFLLPREERCGRWGIRTPGTVNPHVSLANWWFQPLTQPSSRILNRINQASFSNAGAKILYFFCSTKFFCNFFQEKCTFSYFSCFLGMIIGSKLLLSTKKEADLPIIGNLPPVGKGRSMMWWNSECHKHLRALRFCNPPALQLSWHVSLCGPP